MSKALQRCLWLAREMPLPMLSGDRVYTCGLAEALAGTGVAVTFLAHEDEDFRQPGEPSATMRWEGISGGTRSYYWVALADRLPVTAAIHDTPRARARLQAMLDGSADAPFEAIVLDQLGSGWALRPIQRWIAARRNADPAFRAPCLVYLAHNHERVVWADMARDAKGSLIRRLAVANNARKDARLERQLIREVDQVINITDEDVMAMQADGMRCTGTVVTPGYSGSIREPSPITVTTPRRVVIVGSFKWAIKEENLRQFLTAADAVFAEHGIGLDVVGMVPNELREEYEPRLRATILHGYVDDIEPIFDNARLAVVPEMIGGGFKLKFLDYIFGRLPVVSITAAAAGLPAGIREHLVTAPDVGALVEAIVATIDQPERLNHMQEAAFEQAKAAFDWAERGARVKASIEHVLNAAAT